MKKLVIILISIISVVSLTACKKSNESKYNNLNNKESGQTTIEMDLDKNYDTSDPFVNARLFCVSNDIDVLDTEISFKMDGDSGIVEIKDNKTDETLWSNNGMEALIMIHSQFLFLIYKKRKSMLYALPELK